MFKRTAVLKLALLCSLAAASVAYADAKAEPTPLYKAPPGAKVQNSPSGLQYVDIVVGQGDSPMAGDVCIVHFTAWLEDGTEIQSSMKPRPVDPNDPSKGEKTLPFGFKLGSGQVLKGWDEGVATMHEGGTRLLFLPPDLAYGSRGAGKLVPPDAHVIFRISLLKIKRDTGDQRP